MFLHLGLDEDRRLGWVESCGEQISDRFERRIRDPRRIGVVGRQRVPVGDEVVAVVKILQTHPVPDRAEIVAEVDAAGRAKAAEDELGCWAQMLTRDSLEIGAKQITCSTRADLDGAV